MYSDTQTGRTDEYVRRHAPLVKRIAHHLSARLPAGVLLEDLIQAGMIGLIESVKRYDNSKGATFETYAGIRIRGAMLDEIRKGDWAPRSVRRQSREIAHAIQQVEAGTGRDAQDSEVAEALGVSLEQYHAQLVDADSGKLFSLDEFAFQAESQSAETAEEADSHSIDALHLSPAENPLKGIQKGAFLEKLAEQIDALPGREKLVLSLYYDDELNLKEIGRVLSVSESRVSQIHAQAALRLRARLSDWVDA